MRFSTPVYLLTLAALVAADQASDVISLTAQTFESTVNTEPLVLVEFFAPWYGHLIFLDLFISHLQSLGVDIAKPWPLTMRKLQQPSRIRASNSPRSTVSMKLTCVNQTAFKDTRACRSLYILNTCWKFRNLEPWRFIEKAHLSTTMAQGKLTESSAIWSSKSNHPS